MSRLLALAGLCLALAGCGIATAIDNRALAIGLGVDPAPGGENLYTFQVPSPQSLGGSRGGGNSFYFPAARAHSLAQAIGRVEDMTSRDIYLGQLQVILISVKLPPAQRQHFLTEIRRIGETDRTEWIALADGSAAELLVPPKGQEELPASFYQTHFSCRGCQSTDMSIRTWRAEADLASPGLTALLPVVRSRGGTPDIARVAAVQRGGMPLVLSEADSQALMMLLGRMTKGAIRVETPDGPAVVRSLSAHARRKARLVGGRLELADQVTLYGEVASQPFGVVHLTAPALQRIAQATAERLRDQALAVVAKTQARGVDALAFGRQLYMHDANGYMRVRDFAEAYRRARVDVQVRVQLPLQGSSV